MHAARETKKYKKLYYQTGVIPHNKEIFIGRKRVKMKSQQEEWENEFRGTIRLPHGPGRLQTPRDMPTARQHRVGGRRHLESSLMPTELQTPRGTFATSPSSSGRGGRPDTCPLVTKPTHSRSYYNVQLCGGEVRERGAEKAEYEERWNWRQEWRRKVCCE